jgi:hypothetical protein
LKQIPALRKGGVKTVRTEGGGFDFDTRPVEASFLDQVTRVDERGHHPAKRGIPAIPPDGSGYLRSTQRREGPAHGGKDLVRQPLAYDRLSARATRVP